MNPEAVMANAAVFLDRDGTLIQDPGYLTDPDQVQILDGVAEALTEFQQLGYKTVVVSNQSGVARGVLTVETLERIHDRLRELLAAQGAGLDAIYYCPYHPEGTVPEYRKDSDWCKPRPGMLLAAAGEMDLDLAQSWMIGDNDRDIEAGRRAGCKTIRIGSIPTGGAPAEESKPDYRAVNMREAVNILKRYRHSPLRDRRTGPATETGGEARPASRSAQILSMLREHASNLPEEAPPVEGAEASPTPRAAPAPAPAVAASAAAPAAGKAAAKATVAPVAEPRLAGTETVELLRSILEHLRRTRKNEMFGEFSLIRMLAGVVQVFVPFCLLLALWFLLGSGRQDNNVFLALSFAAVLQLMALTFYTMHSRR
jgi:D-glycero-D-manno-heptose 1,7-bisphosphate phosphatase